MQQRINHHYSHQKLGMVQLWSNTLRLNTRLTNLIRSLDHPKDQNVDSLKQDLRRCVLRINDFSPSHSTIIVKGFPLLKIESRLKHQRYGLSEAYNYLKAAELNLPIPECYGYFQLKSWGTVKANGVLIEDLQGYSTLHELAEQQPEEKLVILSQAIPVIQQLYEAGANHIDTTAHNFMQSPDADRVIVIDWQYSSFPEPRNVSQLTLQAVQFLRYTDMTEANSPDWTAWLHELYTTCAPEIDWDEFRQNVTVLQSKKRASNKNRLALSVPMPTSSPEG